MPLHYFLLIFYSISNFGQLGIESDRVLFVSDRNSNSDIFLMSSDGKLEQLTFAETNEWAPTWLSKNEITFLRQENNDVNRYSLDLLNKKEYKIEQPANCILDDKNVLYGSSIYTELYACNGDVFIRSSGQSPKNITNELEGNSLYPSWTFNNDKVILTNDSEGNNEVYLYDPMKKQISNLTNNQADDERGQLSPDGKKLLFSTNRYGKSNYEIAILNLETREVMNVSNTSELELIARWSKDGSSIYYGSNRGGDWELYRYDLFDESRTQLTDNEHFDGDIRVCYF